MSNGSPDVRLVTARAIGRAYRCVLGLRGAELLAYGDPRGHAGLHTALASLLASTRGLPVGPDDVLVTRGSQMALTLAARAILRPGDIVAVEEFGYGPACEAFRAAGATVVPVAIDGDGIDVENLQRLASRTPFAPSSHAPPSVPDHGDLEGGVPSCSSRWRAPGGL